jgi:3-methyl-2-oxobutanoate hydroxymethyltransferase
MTAPKKKITVPWIAASKHKGRRLVMLTAYDATFARLADAAGVDMVLVGDSLGMVVQGHDTTIPVTLDDMIYHCRAVSRGLERAHLVGDMPFMTYKRSAEQALDSAARMVQEGRCESVKLEGGVELAETVARVVAAGIPVVGHVGLTPQSVHALGGFRMRGRSALDRRRVMDDARAVAEAGAFCLVLESMPLELAAEITAAVPIPTVGIGAGSHCDGQVLVVYDMLGMNEDFRPRFLKRYAELGRTVREAVETYAGEVRSGVFPGPEHSVSESTGGDGDGASYGAAPRATRH